MVGNIEINGILIADQAESQLSNMKNEGYYTVDEESNQVSFHFSDADIIALEDFQAGLFDDGRWKRGQNMYCFIEQILEQNEARVTQYNDLRTREAKALQQDTYYINLGEHHRVDHCKWSAIYSAYYNTVLKKVEMARSWATSWR
jgi:hypothetical protein